jgi:GNAT superfamily N-acetyltransferase
MPTISNIYNWPYYNEHIESLGFTKAIDYVEHECQVPDQIPERVTKFAGLIGEKYGLRVADDKSALQKYGGQVLELINQTHQDLHGFVPFTEPVKRHYIKQFMPLLNRDFVALVVDREDNLVAYALSMPSLTQAFQSARGRLFPFGFIQISRALKHVNRADLTMIGVSENLRNKGVTALLFNHLLKTFHHFGVRFVESNPHLEDNKQLLTLWGDYQYRMHKRRRIYQKTL